MLTTALRTNEKRRHPGGFHETHPYPIRAGWNARMMTTMQGYRLSTDHADMDIDAIHAYISRSYWAAGIPRAVLAKAISNSLCFGVFTAAGEQIGFARMVTDRATFAYMADVYILESHRGQGLSKWLVQQVMAHPDLQGLRRINLATADAHGLYRRFGFTALAAPERMMEIVRPDIYRNIAG
jgi:GNAT superfamily N-acetyltransferase